MWKELEYLILHPVFIRCKCGKGSSVESSFGYFFSSQTENQSYQREKKKLFNLVTIKLISTLYLIHYSIMEVSISFYWTTGGDGTEVHKVREVLVKRQQIMYFNFSREIYSLQLVFHNISVTKP